MYEAYVQSNFSIDTAKKIPQFHSRSILESANPLMHALLFTPWNGESCTTTTPAVAEMNHFIPRIPVNETLSL